MNTTFIISGGAGRVVTSIPALEKYHRLNPNDNFKVLVHGWYDLFSSHPILQHRTFEADARGTFELHIKENTVVVPEPYHLRSFYTQQKNLIQAFDEIINSTNDHSDLDKPNLYVSKSEYILTQQIFQKIKEENNNKKIIVFQPFGSGCRLIDDAPFDPTYRSLICEQYLRICKALEDKAVVIYASAKQLKPDDNSIDIDQWNPYLRVLLGFIQQCDYFIGCDSVGQHVARSFNKPGTVIMGASNSFNFTYPNFFNVIKKYDKEPHYTPWRLSNSETEYYDRLNEDLNNFSNDQIEQIIEIIRKDL